MVSWVTFLNTHNQQNFAFALVFPPSSWRWWLCVACGGWCAVLKLSSISTTLASSTFLSFFPASQASSPNKNSIKKVYKPTQAQVKASSNRKKRASSELALVYSCWVLGTERVACCRSLEESVSNVASPVQFSQPPTLPDFFTDKIF